MTTTTQVAPRNMNANDLSMLARTEGPCVTIQLPDFQPGAAPSPSRLTLLRQLTQAAALKLRDLNRLPAADEVAKSIGQLTLSDEASHGGPGMSFFVAPGVSAAFLTPGVREKLTVAEHFDLVDHVSTAQLPATIYALGVSKKRVRLWKVEGGKSEELPLPAGVPESLEAAGGFDQPDHNLENRSSAGPGAMRGVRFGTSSDRDTTAAYLHNFFAIVHRGIKAAVNAAPIFLIGVREELAEYRRAAKNNGILEVEWHSAPDYCSPDQVAEHASDAALTQYRRNAEAVLAAMMESPKRLAGDLEEITKAANEGRIHRLLIAESVTPADRVAAAVAAVLRTGGEVMALPGDSLPGIGAAGAMLRY